MGHAIKFVVSILFVGFIAAFYALLHIDLNQYKEHIEEVASDATGRQLRLEGDVSVAWSLIPTLIIEKATLSNAKWGSNSEMVSLEKLEIRLALYPLLKREVEVTKILLNGPRILVETNKEGVGNWVFDSSSQPIEVVDEDEASSIESIIVNEFDIEQAHITYMDGMTGDKKQVLIERLSIDVADLEKPIEILLKALMDDIPLALNGRFGGVRALTDNSRSLVDLKANVGDIELDIRGEIAKPHDAKGAVLAVELKTTSSALSKLSGNELPAFGGVSVMGDITSDMVTEKLYLDLAGGMDGLNLTLKGHIAEPVEGRVVALDVSLKTDSSTLSLLSGSEVPPIGDISLKGDISNDLETDVITLDLAALAEGLNLFVKGHVLHPKKGDGIALKVNVETNSSTLGVMSGVEFPPVGEVLLSGYLSGDSNVYQFKDFSLNAGKTDLSGDVRVSLASDKPNVTATLISKKIDLTILEQGDETSEPESARLFSDEPLVFDALKKFDANVTINVQEINTASINLNRLDVGVDLQNGRLQILPLDVGFAGSELKGSFDLNVQKDVLSLNTKMQVNEFKLAEIKALKDSISGGNTDFFLQARGTGSTVRQLMAGLNGKAIIRTGKSQIADGTLALLGADFFADLFRMLNPFAKEKTGTELVCSVVNFNIQDGIATAKKGIAVQTGKLNIVGNGTINLKNEAIKIVIKPEARSGIGVNISQLAGLVKVGGTLANPAAQVDEVAVLAAGMSGAAAVATGGLSIVAQGLVNRGTADADPCKTALGDRQ